MRQVITPASDLGAWMVHDFVHRKMLEARAAKNWKLLAELPTWARRMVVRIGEQAGLEPEAVREIVGDD